MSKAAYGVLVNAFFAVGLTFTPLPPDLRQAVLTGIWSCFVLSCLGWTYAHLKESRLRLTNNPKSTPRFARSTNPKSKVDLKGIPHLAYNKDIYQEVLWTWDYDASGKIVNFVARCPIHRARVQIHSTGRQLHPANGHPYQGYTVVCPQCADKIVGAEPLSTYMALDRDLPPQPDLYNLAYAFVEGKIYSGEYAT